MQSDQPGIPIMSFLSLWECAFCRRGLDELSPETGQLASTLSEWRDTFLESGLSGLKQRSSDPRVEA